MPSNTDLPNVEEIRKVRSEEQWVRYDSIVIGPGARDISDTWFNSFSELANANQLLWFTSRRTKEVGFSYSNISGPSEDWAQRIYQTGIEFIAPPGLLGYETQSADAAVLPTIFTTMLPHRMSFQIKVQDLDEILRVPGIHLPGGTGVTGQSQNGAGFLIAEPGQTGDANLRNTWAWPQPVGIPAKSKIEVRGDIDDPLREALRELDTLPGFKKIPILQGNDPVKTVNLANYYQIRIWHRGPRYVQLRGARSSS